jgi:hypothetical protein
MALSIVPPPSYRLTAREVDDLLWLLVLRVEGRLVAWSLGAIGEG